MWQLFTAIKKLFSGKSKAIFAQLEDRNSFLHDPPTEWLKNQDFISGQCIVRGLKVVNDSDERGDVLTQQYNDSITIHKDQKQYMLQVVESHRRLHSKVKKSSV